MFAWGPALRAGKRRTVPVLVNGAERLVDSHDIVAWADRSARDRGLYPDDVRAEVESLEATFDRKVGPAARRLAYHALMTDASAIRNLFSRIGPRWEIAVARVALPVMAGMIKRGLKIDASGVARSRETLAPVLADVEARVEKSGGPWLFGDRFTAADITFAALMTPLVAPPELAAKLGTAVDVSAPVRDLIERHRATPAGRFVLRAYAQERS